MKLINNFIGSIAIIMLLSPAAWSAPMTIPNAFSSGSKAIAADVNDNFTAAKSAIDDNDERISALEYPSVNMDSSVVVTVGRPEGYTSGGATFHFLLSNNSNTDCNIHTAYRTDGWSIGENTKTLSFIKPIYFTYTLPGITHSGFPAISTTYTIVERTATVDFSGYEYVTVTLLRSETDAFDTCNSGDVQVRGLTITYPPAVVGNRQFIPVMQLKIQ